MNLTFLNGTELQQQVVRDACSLLLNFSLDYWDFSWTVSFADDPNPDSHNEFATTYYPGPAERETIFRTDFPDYSTDGFSGTAFALECVGHEIGHCLISLLTSEELATVISWFGGDDLWADEDLAWEDRGQEGAAETFKDAFIPQEYRAFANRTNRKLAINKYPAFRRLFRQHSGDGTPVITPNDRPTFWIDSFDDLGEPEAHFDAFANAVDSEGYVSISVGAFGQKAGHTYTAIFPKNGNSQIMDVMMRLSLNDQTVTIGVFYKEVHFTTFVNGDLDEDTIFITGLGYPPGVENVDDWIDLEISDDPDAIRLTWTFLQDNPGLNPHDAWRVEMTAGDPTGEVPAQKRIDYWTGADTEEPGAGGEPQPDPPNSEVTETGRQQGSLRTRKPVSGSVQ